ncbi:hypothetical protein EC991_006572 [Linnemannia zychae]|nr:hypothetical protein EC991_006572 [Linnemannia zychae]
MPIDSLLNKDKILRSLYPHLARSDLKQLALVNKSWNIAFQALVWRHLAFSSRYSTLVDNSDEYNRVILKNAAHIESLHFRGCPNPAIFLLSFSPCRNIRSFTCHLKFELPQDVFACLTIVEQNQKLVSFFIDGIPIKRLGVAQKLLQVLSQHTNLRRLEFKSTDYIISEHLFTAILQNLPPTLEFLDLNWSIGIQDDNYYDYQDHHVSLPGWSDNGIKTLELNKALAGYEDSVVIPFLHHCIYLQSFRPPPKLSIESGSILTETLREYCPSFKRVLISNQDQDSVNAAVVNGARALETFRIRYYGSVGSNLISSLVGQAAHLHTIEIEDGIFIRSADIQMILSRCPGLRIFTVEDWQEDGHESFLEIKDMISSPWVCLGLQDLLVPIGSDYGNDEAKNAESRQQQRQKAITEAYKQLGALKELRTLSFGLQAPRENSSQFPLDSESKKDFDMTLATGLDELKDLKRLRRLDVSGLRHRMRENELQWIDTNWPALKELAGIFMYEGEELSEDEDTEEEAEYDDIEEDDEADEADEADEEGGEEKEENDEVQGEGDQDKVVKDCATDHELDKDGSEQQVEPKPKPEPEGKMTRRHVAWLLSRRPYVELY